MRAKLPLPTTETRVRIRWAQYQPNRIRTLYHSIARSRRSHWERHSNPVRSRPHRSEPARANYHSLSGTNPQEPSCTEPSEDRGRLVQLWTLLTAAPSSRGFRISAYLGHDSARGGWRARPAAGVWARGACPRAGPAAEARLAPELSPAAPRGDGLAAAGPSPGAPRDDELAAAPPLDPVTPGVWPASEP